MANLVEILALAKREFSTIPWEILISCPTLCGNARLFNQLRLFFSVHGAGFANSIFMQPRTVLCEVQSDVSSAVFADISSIVGLYHIIARVVTLVHFSPNPTMIPLPLVHDMLRAGLGCL
jgi:capsular polysaccharide biosynthesis protein